MEILHGVIPAQAFTSPMCPQRNKFHMNFGDLLPVNKWCHELNILCWHLRL